MIDLIDWKYLGIAWVMVWLVILLYIIVDHNKVVYQDDNVTITNRDVTFRFGDGNKTLFNRGVVWQGDSSIIVLVDKPDGYLTVHVKDRLGNANTYEWASSLIGDTEAD